MAYTRKMARSEKERRFLLPEMSPPRCYVPRGEFVGPFAFGPHCHAYPGREADMRRPVIFLDTETTGTDRERDVPIQVACIVWEEGVITRVEEIFLHPGNVWDEDAEKVHGITRERAMTFPPAGESLRRLAELLAAHPEAVLGGHNVVFDRDMLLAAFQREGLPAPLPETLTDTMHWGRRFGLPGKLTDMVKAAGLPVFRAHDALDDIAMTLNLWLRLMDVVVQRGPRTLFI